MLESSCRQSVLAHQQTGVALQQMPLCLMHCETISEHLGRSRMQQQTHAVNSNGAGCTDTQTLQTQDACVSKLGKAVCVATLMQVPVMLQCRAQSNSACKPARGSVVCTDSVFVCLQCKSALYIYKELGSGTFGAVWGCYLKSQGPESPKMAFKYVSAVSQPAIAGTASLHARILGPSVCGMIRHMQQAAQAQDAGRCVGYALRMCMPDVSHAVLLHT